MPNFIDTEFDSVLDLVRRWRAGARLVGLGGFGRLGRKVASFFDDERLQRIFGFQAMYAGVAPYEALALYAVITYMDSIEGVYVPEGGMHAMVAGLAEALTDAGATIRYDTAVTRILRDGAGVVVGVELDGGERLAAGAVVCNADLPVAYRTLLGGVDAPRVARRGRYSPSCLLWVAGVRGDPPAAAAHHNLHFGTQWDESFRALIADGELMADPSILVTLHSLDDAVAGPGRLLDHLRPRAGAQPRRSRRLDDASRRRRRAAAATGGGGRLPDRRRHRGGLRPAGLGGHGHGAGHPVRPRPHVPPDRTVPASQRRPPRPGPRLRRVVDGARRRRPDGARVGQAGRGPGATTGSGRRDGHAGGQLRRVPPPEQTPRHDVLLVDDGAAGGQAPVRPRPVRVLPLRRRHRRRGRATAPDELGPPRCTASATASSPTSTVGDPTTSSSRPWSTRLARSTSTGTASRGSCGRWRWT